MVKMNLFAGRGYVDIENRHLDTEGEGEGGMNWEIRVDIYTLPSIT